MMEEKDRSSVMVALFKRKGGEGIFTKVIYGQSISQYTDVLVRLDEKEKGLIIDFRDNHNWLLLTNKRLLINKDDIYDELLYGDIVKVGPALIKQRIDTATGSKYTTLLLEDKMRRSRLLECESGKAYYGIYLVLDFMAGRIDGYR